MFHGLWPGLSTEEVPIGSIRNGVHGRSWTSSRVDALLSRAIGDDWAMAGADRWAVVHDLDPAEVWDTMVAGRRGLVRFVRSLLGGGVLNPDTLTIGFARRFATYKRATLLLSQPERLMAMLDDADRPVQFVFAGKAHPADTPGKELIQKIEQFARKANVRGRFVFVADYDIAIARELYHGCDVWLNTPRRPFEACGTSGMKAALNGSLNCSILDGWWDECYSPGNGWAIQSADDDPDLERRDERECASLFSVLEDQVIPRFYELSSGGVPKAWVEMVQESWATLGPRVTAARMVRDYTTDLYEPAAAHCRRLTAKGAKAAVELAQWRANVIESWPSVSITSLDVDASPGDTGTTAPRHGHAGPGRAAAGRHPSRGAARHRRHRWRVRAAPGDGRAGAGRRRCHVPRQGRAGGAGKLRGDREGHPRAPGAGVALRRRPCHLGGVRVGDSRTGRPTPHPPNWAANLALSEPPAARSTFLRSHFRFADVVTPRGGMRHAGPRALFALMAEQHGVASRAQASGGRASPERSRSG